MVKLAGRGWEGVPGWWGGQVACMVRGQRAEEGPGGRATCACRDCRCNAGQAGAGVTGWRGLSHAPPLPPSSPTPAPCPPAPPAGATLELSTIAMPSAFLPLACTANLFKNLAAVAASSTRAPIYRTFAQSNNLVSASAAGAHAL